MNTLVPATSQILAIRAYNQGSVALLSKSSSANASTNGQGHKHPPTGLQCGCGGVVEKLSLCGRCWVVQHNGFPGSASMPPPFNMPRASLSPAQTLDAAPKATRGKCVGHYHISAAKDQNTDASASSHHLSSVLFQASMHCTLRREQTRLDGKRPHAREHD
eukprot:scaffold4802_cov21-Tisochrysis_lutea.AAC.1